MRRIAIAIAAAAMAGVACGSSDQPKAAEADPVGSPDDGVIRLTPEQIANAGIATAKAEHRSTTGVLVTTAEVQPAEDGVARVGARLAGRITALDAGAGDHVKKNQRLATLDSAEVGRAKAEYQASLVAWKVAQQSLERERELFDKKYNALHDVQVAEAEEARARADRDAAANLLSSLGVGASGSASTLRVTAPIDGEIVERAATLGQMVETTDTMFVIMDLRQVWIVVDLLERDLAQVAVGQRVSARVSAYPEREFPGTIAAIGATVEPRSRTVHVRVVLPNDDRALKPGMFADVEVEGASGVAHDRVVVPSAAVQRDGTRMLVFVPHGEREFVAREVAVGRESAGWTEIDGGLTAGETVVTTGSFVLKSETRKGEMGED